MPENVKAKHWRLEVFIRSIDFTWISRNEVSEPSRTDMESWNSCYLLRS